MKSLVDTLKKEFEGQAESLAEMHAVDTSDKVLKDLGMAYPPALLSKSDTTNQGTVKACASMSLVANYLNLFDKKIATFAEEAKELGTPVDTHVLTMYPVMIELLEWGTQTGSTYHEYLINDPQK